MRYSFFPSQRNKVNKPASRDGRQVGAVSGELPRDFGFHPLPSNRALRGNDECQSEARATGRETARERKLYNRRGLVLLFPGLYAGPLAPIHPIEPRIQ